eukprot:CAMPEP_0170197598 /NCGR_PEP_ID=MMETSP0040_2-20121228/66749_1 /TAXON_ID=641309 /ORGANISM="Lotharella oceanica, Strain CCMP622" /LENGTH=43 /DNA_ID= /DNA_START= /DNA_END= /DNA_ORIENTATION=
MTPAALFIDACAGAPAAAVPSRTPRPTEFGRAPAAAVTEGGGA